MMFQEATHLNGMGLSPPLSSTPELLEETETFFEEMQREGIPFLLKSLFLRGGKNRLLLVGRGTRKVWGKIVESIDPNFLGHPSRHQY